MEKVAVVNRTLFKNYGSVLQCFALSKAVEKFGYSCDIIWSKGSLSKNFDLRYEKIFSIFMNLLKNPSLIKVIIGNLKSLKNEVPSKETTEKFDYFVEKNINHILYSKKELKTLVQNNYYYKYICGSDQIWNPTSLYLDPLLFLRFSPKNKRIAYAPSLGCDIIPNYNKSKLKKYILGIPNVSIRETQGQKLLEELCGVKFPVVSDPTLLFDMDFWKGYAAPCESEGYLLYYFLNEPSEEIQGKLIDLCKNTQKKAVIINSPLKYLSKSNIPAVYPDCGPSEFLGLVKNADYIITDSYHGMLFSIIFEKNFLSVPRNYKEHDQSSRQKSVLDYLGLEERYTIDICNDKLTPIEYGLVNVKIEQFRQYSYDFLNKALNAK
jgi:hypothetical protein